MFDMPRIIISRVHLIIARSLHGDLRGRSVAAAPRGAGRSRAKNIARPAAAAGRSTARARRFGRLSHSRVCHLLRAWATLFARAWWPSPMYRRRWWFDSPSGYPPRGGALSRARPGACRGRAPRASLSAAAARARAGGAVGGGRTGAHARRAHRPGALRRRCHRRHRTNRSAVARRRRRERHASRRRTARASLRVHRLGHQRQRRREHARRGRRRRGQGHVQVDRAPVVVVVLFVAFDRSSCRC